MTNEQRRKFWALLGDISAQVQWPVNGEPTLMHKDDWRLVFCAAYAKENRIAAGIEGGHVVLGLRLRDLFKGLDDETAKRQASELIELVTAFGSRYSVAWTDPEWVAMCKAEAA